MTVDFVNRFHLEGEPIILRGVNLLILILPAHPCRYKQSGMGRELGSYALDNYTQVKSIIWDYSAGSQ